MTTPRGGGGAGTSVWSTAAGESEGRQLVAPLMAIPRQLRKFGVAPADVLAEAGLAADALDDPAGCISFLAAGRLLAACVAQTKCRYFGLLAGRHTGTANLRLVGQLMRSAPTLGAALLDFVGNQHRLVSGAVPYLLAFGDTAVLGYAVYQPGVIALDQITDMAVAAGFNILRELAGVVPAEAMLAHAAPQDARAHRQLLPAPIRFNAEQTCVTFPSALLARPTVTADPVLRVELEARVALYWAFQEPDMKTRLLRLLRPRIVVSPPSVGQAAAYLSLHPRTLNRRLHNEGTSFRQVLNEARFEAARQLLSCTRISLTEIAVALAYSDSSVFTHAFQRWAGTTPSDWRLRMQTIATAGLAPGPVTSAQPA